MRNLKILLIVIYSLIINSCSSVREHAMNVNHLTQIEAEKKQGLYYADFDATKRGALIIHEKDNTLGRNSVRILAEPPPDAALAFAKSFAGNLTYEKIDVGVASALAETLEKLTNRTTSINFLRDALYRLNEYDFNNSLTKKEYKTMFDSIISASKKIAEAELKKVELETTREERKIAEETTKQITKISEEKQSNINFNSFPIYFHICKENDRSEAKKMVAYLNKLGYIAVGTELIDYNISENQVRYFNEIDKELAESIADNLQNGFQISKFSPRLVKLNRTIPLGRVEVWIK